VFFGILTLATALIISLAAIYYSVSGLMLIFAGAPLSVMIMGSILEFSKLVAIVWLHKYWKQSVWWLKFYLLIAVLLLMIITSMGIFGGLSRAHIEQTANVTESIIAVDRLDSEIARQQQIIARAESAIETLESRTNIVERDIQSQIDREQARIDSAYSRIQPAIDEQMSIIQQIEQDLESRSQLLVLQITEIDQILQDLQNALSSNDIRRAQGIVGERQDGSFGPSTTAAIQLFRENQIDRRNSLESNIDRLRTESSDQVSIVRSEIARLRNIAEQQISDSNILISRFRSQLGQTDQTELQVQIDEQLQRIQQANILIDQLADQKFAAERQFRIFESEVGPIKYIAELVYGSSDDVLLEQAVRWVIIIIIFVFDPLAVLLLIASQYTISYERSRKNEKIENTDVQPSEISKTVLVEPDVIFTEDLDSIDNSSIFQESPQKKSSGSLEGLEDSIETEEEQLRLELWNEKEISLRDAKHQWKEQNPNETIKFYKTLYIKGKIDQLPWENSTYIQNSEQNERSLFRKIQELRSNDKD
jgi:hypothetical protein